MRVFEGEHTDSGNARCGSGEVYCVQCFGGSGAASRYVWFFGMDSVVQSSIHTQAFSCGCELANMEWEEHWRSLVSNMLTMRRRHQRVLRMAHDTSAIR